MKTGEFIRDLMSERGITARELSRRIGVSHVTIGKWLRNDFQPSGKNLETLAAFFSVTPAAIIFGETCHISPRLTEVSEDEIAIPVIDLRASCGYGLITPPVTQVRMFRATRAWLASRLMATANLSALRIITADGDSMAPGIHNGDFAFIDTTQLKINADALYALQYGGSIFIKRVMMKADGGVVLISDNERYPAQTIDDPESLRVVGRVVLVFNVREP